MYSKCRLLKGVGAQSYMYRKSENFQCSNIFEWSAGIRKLKARKFGRDKLLKHELTIVFNSSFSSVLFGVSSYTVK